MIFQSLHELSSKVVITGQLSKDQLEGEKVKILQTLATIEAQGPNGVEDAELSGLVTRGLGGWLVKLALMGVRGEG
jgi:hypothetical protein